jgi:Flp pilus assembly protein TadG
MLAMLRRWRLARDGGPAVELGLVLPLLIAMIYGVIEAGRLFWTISVLQFAVEQAARCAVVDSNTCSGSGTNTAQCDAAAWALGLGLACGDFTLASCANGAGKEVSISYTFQSMAMQILPGGSLFTVNINAGSCYPT